MQKERQKKMQRKQHIKDMTAWLLAGIVLVLSAGFLIADRRTFSENENRYLAELPVLSWEKIKSGAYMEELNDYLSDHFPFRDFFIGFKTSAETAAGKREINGVYIGDDGYLIESYEKPDNTERIVRTLAGFAEELDDRDLELRLMLIPTASYVYSDKLPAYAPLLNQMETAEQIYEAAGIAPADCSQSLLLQKNGEALYYKTDHHWTTYGAYIGYRAFCGEMGLKPVPLEKMIPQTVTEDFRGTLYSKSGVYGRKGDTITIYVNPEDRLKVEYKDTGETTDSLYNLEYVEKKDKYSLFLDNLHPLIEITNETAESDRELALIKDSYANSMVPFLVRHYKKVYVFDTRYYKEGPSAFIEEHPDVTDVLLLYNLNTLNTDTGIRGVY